MPSAEDAEETISNGSYSKTKGNDSSNNTSGGPSVHEEPRETSPLLSTTPKTGRGLKILTVHTLKSPRSMVLLMIFILILFESGEALIQSPQARILESVICYRWYERTDPTKLQIRREDLGPGAIGGVAEMWCKVDEVQSELAMLRGWQQLFYGIPSLLFAIPFGWAADRFGRRPFILLGTFAFPVRAAWIQLVTCFWKAFDIRMTWFSALLGSFGGGNSILAALFFVCLNDVVPDEDRAAVFLRVGAADLVATLIVPPLSALLMRINPWIPTLGGTLFDVVAAMLCITLPETLNYKQHLSSSETTPSTAPIDTATANATPSRGKSEPLSVINMISRSFGEFRISMAFLVTDLRVLALISCFFLHVLSSPASNILLLQYVSKRYDLTFSEATLVLSIRASVNLVFLLVILPHISTLVTRRWNLPSQRKDLYLARASAVPLAVGWFLTGAAPDTVSMAIALAVCSLSIGTILLVRSFMTAVVPAHHVAKLYSVVRSAPSRSNNHFSRC